jgi:glycosyltransferase involved in cell wall biosynthesis
MIKDALVTVVIPCFNAERYLAQAIDSALSQTHANIEVLVVDDGSTDGSRDVIASYGSRIRSHIGPNAGPSRARNTGIDLARGTFTQFLDADDLLSPTKVEACLQAAPEAPSLAFSRLTRFSDEPSATPSRLTQRFARLFRTHPPQWGSVSQLEYILRTAVQTSVILHRTDLLRRVGGFRTDIKHLEDTDLALRLTLSGVEFRLVDEALVMLRDHRSPQRLRHASTGAMHSYRAAIGMFEHVVQAQALTPPIQQAFADRFANYGRKLYWQGHVAEADEAFRRAMQLSRRPAPTGVPLYNLAAQTFGLAPTERVVRAAWSISHRAGRRRAT